jgi:adenylate kinase
MHLVLLGAPGAGKGTQVERLKGKLGLVHVATGDLLRKAVKERTLLGQKAQNFIKEGKLVSDDIVLELLEDRIREEKKGFILDGFPRNLWQAKKLDEILHRENRKLDLVINLEVKESTIIERLSRRLVCSSCGRIYNKENLGDFSSKCRVCGASFFQRDDDNPEAIKERIKTYLKHTHPLISYYRKKKILYNIEGKQSPEEITRKILNFLGKKEKI